MWVAALFSGGLPGVLAQTEAAAPDFEQLQDAVVRIITIDKEGKAAVGSGVIESKNRTVVTNAHVVRKAASIYVLISGPDDSVTFWTAALHSLSITHDLAILQLPVEAASYIHTTATPDDQSAVRPLQSVVAVGFPSVLDHLGSNGLDLSSWTNLDYCRITQSKTVNNYMTPNITQGSVSKVTEDLIVHDAKISPGSSGGALFDASTGRLIGITQGGAASKGTTFFLAIPIQYIKNCIFVYPGLANAPAAPKTAPPESRVEDLVRRHLCASNSDFTNGLYASVSCFAPEVIYFDKGSITQDEILLDNVDYIKRFPKRRFVVERVHVKKNDQFYFALAVFRCTLRSRQGKTSNHHIVNTYLVKFYNGEPLIVGIKGKAVKEASGSSTSAR